MVELKVLRNKCVCINGFCSTVTLVSSTSNLKLTRYSTQTQEMFQRPICGKVTFIQTFIHISKINKMNFLKNKKTRRALNKNYKSSLQLVYSDNINTPVNINSVIDINVGDNHLNINNQSDFTHSEQSSEGEFAYSVDSSVVSKTVLTKLASDTSNFKESLQSWALRHNITHSATTDLLKLLKQHHCFKESLPSDSRALLSTPRYSSVKDISPGQYIDFQWSDHIRNFLADNPNQVAKLQVNIDGIPVYKSSNKSLWPILGTPLPSITPIVLSTQEPSSSVSKESAPSHVLGLLSVPEDNIQMQASISDPNIASSSIHTPTTSQHVSLDSTPMDLSRPTPNSKFETWVIRNMSIMKAQLNQIQESIDVIHDQRLRENSGAIAAATAARETEDCESYKWLPIRSMEQIDQLKDYISDDTKRRALIEKLSNRGGNSASECVRRILQRLLTNDVAVNFNWIGSRGQKMGFKNSILLEVVHEATRKSKRIGNVEEKVMEDIIKDWLKNAKKRIASEEISKTKDQSRGGAME